VKRGGKFDPVRLGPPLLFAVLALIYISQSGGFMDPVSAEAPLLYGKLLLGLSALILALGLVAGLRGTVAVRETGIQALQDDAEEDLGKILLIYAILAAFIGSIFAIGFFAAIPIFLVLFLRLVAKLPLWQSLLSAAVSVLFVWLVFVQFLHMVVYPGSLLRSYMGF
jgi:hypothetical protein